MSKTSDKIKSLLAEYEGRHPGALKLKPRTNKAHADIAAHVKAIPRQSPPLPPPSPQVTKQKIVTQYSHLRPPPGLVWTSFVNPDGTTIPVLTILGHEYDNYAAVKNVRPAGTYTIYKLDPRKAISYKCLAKDIKHYIEQDVKRENTLRENLAFTKRQKEAKIEADKRAFLDQPGFYIIPGESVGPDDKVYNATGPYCRFETAGIEFHLTSEYITTSTPSETTDVEDDALETARSLPNTHVKIIEARNPVEAAAGNGHVWWQDGLFRGPPVDPRQSGFRW